MLVLLVHLIYLSKVFSVCVCMCVCLNACAFFPCVFEAFSQGVLKV